MTNNYYTTVLSNSIDPPTLGHSSEEQVSGQSYHMLLTFLLFLPLLFIRDVKEALSALVVHVI